MKQLATLIRASSVSEKHGHLRAVQAYAVVRNSTDICNQATSYSYTSEQRERVKHGHLRAVQAYTVVRSTTDMQSRNYYSYE